MGKIGAVAREELCFWGWGGTGWLSSDRWLRVWGGEGKVEASKDLWWYEDGGVIWLSWERESRCIYHQKVRMVWFFSDRGSQLCLFIYQNAIISEDLQ